MNSSMDFSLDFLAQIPRITRMRLPEKPKVDSWRYRCFTFTDEDNTLITIWEETDESLRQRIKENLERE